MSVGRGSGRIVVYLDVLWDLLCLILHRKGEPRLTALSGWNYPKKSTINLELPKERAPLKHH
jgi:hypothetical protein